MKADLEVQSPKVRIVITQKLNPLIRLGKRPERPVAARTEKALAVLRAFTVWNVTTLPVLKPAFWLSLHCLPLLLLQLATRKRSGEEDLPPWHWTAKGLIYAVLFIAIASSAVAEKEFIYFQF